MAQNGNIIFVAKHGTDNDQTEVGPLEEDGNLLWTKLLCKFPQCSGLWYNKNNQRKEIRPKDGKLEVRQALSGNVPTQLFYCFKDITLKYEDVNPEIKEELLINYFSKYGIVKLDICPKRRLWFLTISCDLDTIVDSKQTIGNNEITIKKLEHENEFLVMKGTRNQGALYEDIFIASLVFELVMNQEIQNFKISSNNEEFHPFDDVVIEVEYMSRTQMEDKSGRKNSDGRENAYSEIKDKLKYCLQLKLGENNKSLEETLRKGRNKTFNIEDYFYEYCSKNIKLQESNDCHYIYFTNRTFKGSNFEQCETDPIFAKCFDEHNVFKFCKLRNFSLYTDQLNVKNMEQKLCERFKNEFGCEKNIFEKYIKFFNNWSQLEIANSNLDKTWMKNLIAICLLSPYVKPITFDSKDNEKIKILRDTVNSFDITIFNKKRANAVQSLWTKDWFLKLDVNEIKKEGLKYHLIDCIDEDLTNETKSQILWLLEKCPLIIANNSENIFKIMRLCENKKFVLLHEDAVNYSTQNLKIKWNIFQNLADLKTGSSLYNEILKTFTCCLQGKSEINLRALIGENNEIRERITPDDLLSFINNSYTIGGRKEVLSSYIDRFYMTPFINPKFLNKNEGAVIIVSRFDNSSDFIQHINKIDITTVLSNKQGTKCKKSEQTIYVTEGDFTKDNFDKLCKIFGEENRYHHFKMSEGKLKWIISHGDIEDLRDFVTYGESPERVLHENAENHKFLIFCGDPGMGKSYLAKNFKNNALPCSWTVLINPKDHAHHFNQNSSADAFAQYMLSESKKQLDDFNFRIFEILLKKNRINYIWDGLDEVSESNLPSVLNVVEELSKKGLRQLLTSRNNLRATLEVKFKTFARQIKGFHKEQQVCYIRERLKCKMSHEVQQNADTESQFKDIINKINNNIEFFKYNEILAIPLQIFMFTELYFQSVGTKSSFLDNLLSVSDLFEYFIEGKFQFYYKDKEKIGYNTNDRVNMRQEDDKTGRIENYQLAALITYFPEQTFGDPVLEHFNKERRSKNIESNSRNSLTKFLKKIKEEGDPFGIITSVFFSIPNFIHNTFGEYFAASYLAKYYKDIKNLSDYFFEEKFRNIRFLFDSILSKGKIAHIATLYKNINVLENCTLDLLTSEDEGGRNPLHLACSWGERYPPLKVKTIESDDESPTRYIVYEEYENQTKKPNFEHQNILRLLSRFCNPENTDQVYELSSYSYADETFCLSSLAILSEKYIVDFSSLKNFKEISLVLYYSAAFDFSAIFNNLKIIPRVYTQKGESLLSVAATNGSLASCEQLLKHKVDVESSNQDKERALYSAAENGHLEIVDLLLENGAQVNAAHWSGRTPLYTASENGKLEIVKLLVKDGAQVNAANKDGWTPLYRASKNGHSEIAELLVKNGAQVNAADEYGRTPLYAASENSHVEIVELLIKNKAEINTADGYGRTPLYMASVFGHVAIVELLVKKEAQVNIADEDGMTPLYIASISGWVKIVELLIKNGAQVNAADKAGCPPLYRASEFGHLESVELLVKNGAQVNIAEGHSWIPLYVASEYGHVEIAELLVKNGAQVNAAHWSGRTPLYVAAENGNVETVTLLVKNGAQMNAANNDGGTPLYRASKNGHLEIVELLVINGALVNAADKYGRTPLYAACEDGHVEIVELLIKNGAQINAANEDGWTPLHIASTNGKVDIVELLVKNGAQVNGANKDAWTPLYAACEDGHVEIVELLVQNEAQVNAADKDGWIPLHRACENGHLDIVELLVKNGAQVNTADKEGWTPLYVASKNGHLKIVELLNKNGAQLNAAGKDGWTPLHGAYENGQLNIVELLVKNEAQVNAVDEDGWTPLYVACKNGHLDIVELLVKNGAQVNDVDEYGCTPLYAACEDGHMEIVELLVKNRAQVNTANEDGRTPLYIASRNGHVNIIPLLIKNGAQVNAVNKNGWTPLHIASQNGQLGIVKLLSKNGAQVNAANKDGWAPLHIASQNGDLEIVKLLNKNGAQVNVADEYGLTPLYIACGNGHLEIVELLIKNGAQVNDANIDGWAPLHKASKNGHLEMVEFLVNNGAQVNATNKDGWTPLHIASQNGDLEIIKLLNKNGAQVNAADEYGLTPLYIACGNGPLETVELLIKNGAQVNAANKEGWAPLHRASHNGHVEIVESLVKYEAQVNATNKDGWTPLYVASENGHLKIVELLNKNGAQLNAAGKDGWTPLHGACENGHLDIVELLVENGAQVNVANKGDWTPLHIASQNGNMEIVESLVKHEAQVNATNKDGWTALHIASQNGQLKIVDLLVKNGAEMNSADSSNMPSSNGNVELVELGVENVAHGNI